MRSKFDYTVAGNTLRLVELSDGTIKNGVQIAKSEYFRKFLRDLVLTIYIKYLILIHITMPKKDKIRRKNVRGKAYNKERIIELFDEGYSYEQIAKKLHIKSVQSLRHSVEKEVRKRAERLLEAQREMQIKEQQRKEQMRMEV